MIAVTFALPAESSAFVSKISQKMQSARNGLSTIRGYVASKPIEVLHTGVGKSISERRTDDFLKDQHFELLISSGFAGAVSASLGVGDLVLAENFSDPRLLSTAREVLKRSGVRCIMLATAPGIIDSQPGRAGLASATGADAIDMETKWIANSCSRHGVPALSLRVVSDTPARPLPAPPAVLFDLQRQRTPMTRLAGYALKYPAVLGRLLRFQRQIVRSRRTLADAIITVVSEL